MGHSSVNQPLRLLLRTMYDKLVEIPYTNQNGGFARIPDEAFVMSQRPRIIFYTTDVLKFIATIINKVSGRECGNLIRLLFCKSDVGLINKFAYIENSSAHE